MLATQSPFLLAIPGAHIYDMDSDPVRTRRWTWRQSERGKITEETTAILYPIDGFTDVNEAEVKAAAAEFVTLLRRFFGEGVTIETGFVEREHPRFEFF